MAITIKLDRPPLRRDEFSRADLEFRGVDHSGPSFEARVFLDNPNANADSGRDPDAGYAGSFYVFGHGGCFGELGHCDMPTERRGPYDLRLPHQLLPQFRTVIITDALRRVIAAGDANTLTVTVVPVMRENTVSQAKDSAEPLKFEGVSLYTYADTTAAGVPLPS
jgi:hypothetical protein